MNRIRRILVAVKDPTEKSLPGVAKAAQLARASGAELELFHAIDSPISVDVLSLQGISVKHFEKNTREERLQQLERIAARVRRQGVTVTTAAEWDFPAYESILRRAKRIHPDLIVAECHTQRHVAPRLLRLTDWELLRSSPVPVLMIKSPRPYRQPVVLTAVDPTHAFSKPLRLDREILRTGSTVADALGGKLHVMHAYSPSTEGTVMLPPVTATMTSIIAEIQSKSASKAKTEFERLLKSESIPANRAHLVLGHPIDAIQNTARKLRPAIMVMGAVARSGIKRLAIGNTAERVFDHLDCDLLVVKPRGFTSRVPKARRGSRLTISTPPPL